MMIDPLNYFLDRITMYRLLLYILLAYLGIAFLFASFGILKIDPVSLAISSVWMVFVCYVANKVFAWAFDAPTNVESVYLTALILILIINPIKLADDFIFLGWAGTLAIASKYILAIHKKHIFNPAAIAVVITAFTIDRSASWWIASTQMAPFLLIGGLLIVKKIQRFDLLFSFVAPTVLISLALAISRGSDPAQFLKGLFFDSSILFFAFIMLTEPLTTPPTRKLRMIYGAIVGVLFVPNVHLGTIYSTPELALVLGNIASYVMSPKHKIVMKLSKKTQIAPDIVDYEFEVPDKNFKFTPGQYMEWTFPHPHTDSRGNRRYFTIASSPTEQTLRLGIKFYENGSSFKRNLKDITQNAVIVGGQLSGDFTLPKDMTKKYVFVAGGIGITPFRSMLKYLIDTNTKFPATVLFSNKLYQDIVYKDILDEAKTKLAINTYYTLTDVESIPENWKGGRGRIDAKVIQQIPDYKNAYYYLSGPHVMVAGFEKTLAEVGVPKRQIKKDFFPGFV